MRVLLLHYVVETCQTSILKPVTRNYSFASIFSYLYLTIVMVRYLKIQMVKLWFVTNNSWFPVNQSQLEKSFGGEDRLLQLRETLTSQSRYRLKYPYNPCSFNTTLHLSLRTSQYTGVLSCFLNHLYCCTRIADNTQKVVFYCANAKLQLKDWTVRP